MANGTAFEPGSLQREIAIRGLSQGAFAEQAEIDIETLARAIKGQRLHTKTFGKILTALDRIPVVGGPIDLVQTA